MGFPRQECWSGLPFPSPGDLPNPGIKPTSPALAGRFFTTESPGKPCSFFRDLEKFSNSVQFSTVTQSCPTHCDPLDCITNSQSLLKLMSIELVMPSNHLILCHPRLLPPSIFPSIQVFSNESLLHIRWPKYWSFSFSISPSSEYSGLISFRMNCMDLLAVLGTLKSLLQHHSSKTSILQCSAFFMVQLYLPC